MDRLHEPPGYENERRESSNRLSAFIREHEAEIVLEWEREARRLPHARGLDRPALIDHIPDLLDRIAEMADELSAGGHPSLPKDVAELHAIERLDEGFDLSQVVAEFALLRDAITRSWEGAQLPASQLAELRLLNQALDRAISESVDRYTKARERALQGLDRIANAALESRSLDELLQRLLRVLLETTPAVDTAAILLRDGDRLCVRAAVGLEEEVATRFSLRIGEGFAGTIAADGRPKLLRTASTDPLVKSPLLRNRGVRALYGVPLTDGGEIIGVAHIGSLTAHQFSEQDKRLLAAMASRATAAIYQHILRENAATRARQQEAVANLGAFALETVSVQPIMQRAVELVAETLGVELVKVLELEPDGRSLVLRAGVGWEDGLVGRAIVDAARDSHVGYTLASAEPVIMDDLRTETRFKGAPILHAHGVLSGLTAIIQGRGHGSRPYGVIGAHARTQRSFTSNDVTFLQAIANVVAAAIMRRKTEAELHAAEQRLSLYPEQVRLLAVLADSVPILVSYIDRDLRYQFANRAYEVWFDRSRDDIHGKHVRDVLGDEAVDRISGYFDAALRGQTVTYEEDLPYKAGARNVEATYLPDFAPDGTVAGFVGIIADISERKRAAEAEKKARTEAERALAVVDALLGSSLVGFGFIDTELRYVRVNDALANMNGAAAGDHVGRTVREVLGDDADLVEPALRKVLETRTPLADLEATVASPTTERARSFLVNYFPVMTPGGQMLGIGAAVVEITERKRMEEDLRDRELRLRKAVRMREELLAVVSHDLKNPLAAIELAGSMLLRKDARDPGARKQVETINRSANRMEHLIGDLLDMSSIQVGKLALDKKSEEVSAVLTEAVEMHRPAAQQKGVTLIDASRIEGLRLPMDRHRILQVLENLLGNAIKFCRAGDRITVRAQRFRNEARFAVEDTGPGIPASEVSRVFEPYWSGEQHAKEGTGLGLYISRGIVEAHGGRISVESRPGHGATFRFTLPISAAPKGQ